jgi:hypothetical protein
MVTSKKEPKKSLFDRIPWSDTLVLALIPIGAQLLWFAFQYGYLHVFRIPVTLISFDWIDLFLVLLALASLTFLLYYFADTYISISLAQAEPYRDKLHRVFGGFLMVIFYAFAFGPTLWKEWRFILILFLGSVVFEFGYPLIKYREKETYREKLLAHTEDRRKPNKDEFETPFEKLLRQLGPYFLLFLLALFGVYQYGRANALKKTEFLIVDTKPEKIVLWMDDEYFIVKTFDIEKETFGSSFEIFPVGKAFGYEFRYAKIGPLRAEQLVTDITITRTPTPVFQTQTANPTLSITATTKKMPTQTSKPIPTKTPIPTP